MDYVYEEDVTKAGYTPVVRDDWIELIAEADVISDTSMRDSSHRYRVLHYRGHWYVWLSRDSEHQCWEISDHNTLLSLEEFNRLRSLFGDIEKWSTRLGD